MNKKFILVDPSFDGTTGDKWQYALAFARSARANGYDFVLLAARGSPQLPPIDGLSIDQRPIFSDGFYEHERIVTRHLRTGAAQAATLRTVVERRQRQRLDEEIQRASEDDDTGRREWLQRERALLLRRAARDAEAAEPGRLDDPDLARPFNRDDFGVALADELTQLGLSRGDVLFFHTMTPAMLESFAEATLRRGEAENWDVDAYCLFHFGAEAPDARTFLDRYYSYSQFGSLALRLRSGGPFRRLHLLATSEELRSECERLFGLPFGIFHGLSNLGEHLRACGGEAALREGHLARDMALREHGRVRLAVRASDINEAVARGLTQADRRLRQFGFEPEWRVLYHSGSLPGVRDVLDWLGQTPVTLVNTQDNDEYVRELAQAHLVLLTYPPERYAKRVSAVLHDCAVIGTPCLVPEGTTMARSGGFADVWVYRGEAEIGAVVLQAVRALASDGDDGRADRIERARAIYAVDVVQAVLAASAGPSLEVPRRGPVAAFFMPAWGRCGSSYAMEGQLRYLLRRGFFVIQVLVMDKPLDERRAIPYLWRMLLENSQLMRASVQRIAFAREADVKGLLVRPGYLKAPAFDQYLERIATASLHCPDAERGLREARVAVVNHVFHARLARRLVQCPCVLETHDIQSYQMHAWPLRRADDDTVEPLGKLLQRELAEIHDFDHVINVAPNEHQMLSTANPRSSLVTPYVVFEPRLTEAKAPTTVDALAREWKLGPWYLGLGRFDLLLLGDSHKANLESAEWFMQEVYLPHLQPLGRSLAIAGRVTEPLYKRFGTVGNVFYMGFVPDVQTVRGVSAVAVLPDKRGTGISIKTLETFASGQAFVATSRALRGFAERLPPGLQSHDDPKAFAARVEVLLADDQERAREAGRAREAYARIASEEAFMTAWDEVLDGLGVTA